MLAVSAGLGHYFIDLFRPSQVRGAFSAQQWQSPNSSGPQDIWRRYFSSPVNTPKPREIGVNPSELVGKVLKHVQRSRNHPSVTLHFTDNTVYQILVDGYNPVHRGLPKDLEMDSGLEPILNPADGRCDVNLTLTNATVITMVDKAFQLGERESQWDQQHSALALRFAEDNQWHCVWATLMDWERDESGESRCVFRSYHDVYVNTFQPSVRKGAGVYKSFWRGIRKLNRKPA
ncbi:hypothetical protein SCP_0308100 [Sparassis crispa]|uniref:Uncharacterized protein n=1 Tax=Sparassis crispa TaxID=139825 RepID=A0A401GG35_9APHY|nr:hypothetical protein SCP_0308100 [Sparassis crispa]GBE81085.1 hypothetical protein SCP_0308100 [Sparassis crispa]